MKFELKEILNKDGYRTGFQRAKVFGGWIVYSYNFRCIGGNDCMSEAMTFVPDPNHEWEIAEETT